VDGMAGALKSRAKMDQVVDLLLTGGWREDGKTRTEIVRMPTTSTPVLCGGKTGGKLTTFGGRLRYTKDIERRADQVVGKGSAP
jgi:hypothetical protein